MVATTTDHALERLVFFSDAVFAIAITLLVIELHPPHLPYSATAADHLRALADLAPSLIGFAVSFAVIGAFWAGHHRAFALAGHYGPRILPWNLALLSTIAFMPFATAYMSANGGARVPAILYSGTLLAAALLNIRVQRIATRPPMLDEAAAPDAVAQVRVRGLSVALGAGSAVLLSIAVPPIGQIGLATIPLWRRLLTPRPPAPAQADGPGDEP